MELSIMVLSEWFIFALNVLKIGLLFATFKITLRSQRKTKTVCFHPRVESKKAELEEELE